MNFSLSRSLARHGNRRFRLRKSLRSSRRPFEIRILGFRSLGTRWATGGIPIQVRVRILDVRLTEITHLLLFDGQRGCHFGSIHWHVIYEVYQTEYHGAAQNAYQFQSRRRLRSSTNASILHPVFTISFAQERGTDRCFFYRTRLPSQATTRSDKLSSRASIIPSSHTHSSAIVTRFPRYAWSRLSSPPSAAILKAARKRGDATPVSLSSSAGHVLSYWPRSKVRFDYLVGKTEHFWLCLSAYQSVIIVA